MTVDDGRTFTRKAVGAGGALMTTAAGGSFVVEEATNHPDHLRQLGQAIMDPNIGQLAHSVATVAGDNLLKAGLTAAGVLATTALAPEARALAQRVSAEVQRRFGSR